MSDVLKKNMIVGCFHHFSIEIDTTPQILIPDVILDESPVIVDFFLIRMIASLTRNELNCNDLNEV